MRAFDKLLAARAAKGVLDAISMCCAATEPFDVQGRGGGRLALLRDGGLRLLELRADLVHEVDRLAPRLLQVDADLALGVVSEFGI